MKQYTIQGITYYPSQLTTELDKNIIITEAQSEEFTNISSMITDILGKNNEVQAVFGLLLFEDRVGIIGRARSNGAIHVGNICKIFGGGGHPSAASATIKGVTLPEVNKEAKNSNINAGS